MKKKGFTLIELLAVIVILAIIAVITVPKIADMILSSRQGGAEDSFYGTLKAAELGYTKALQSNTNLKGSTCNIEDRKITCTNGVNVEVSGKTPESGTLVIDSAGSTIAKALTLNGYKCYGDLSTNNPCVKTDIDVANETLIKKVTTSGEGLYKDTYEEGRYVYRGANPNNYLTLNSEDAGWRIVSVENDGTIKIIHYGSIGKMAYDNTTVSDSRYNDDNTYCKNLYNSGTYYGCNAWSKIDGKLTNGNFSGTVTKDSSLNTYLNGEYYNTLNNEAKKNISTGKFNVGFSNPAILEVFYKNEKTLVWNGKIAIPNVSDFTKASLDTTCNTVSAQCSTGTPSPCSNNNYLFHSSYMWFINPTYNFTHAAFTNYGTGQFCTNGATSSYNIYPVLYLRANIELTGTGTESDPYKIK